MFAVGCCHDASKERVVVTIPPRCTRRCSVFVGVDSERDVRTTSVIEPDFVIEIFERERFYTIVILGVEYDDGFERRFGGIVGWWG